MDNDKSIETKRESMRYSPRRKLLELKDILYENADENNGITMKDILDKLQTACGAMPDKKTVYTDLGVLEEYGMKVLRPHGRETEYRLIRGENELSYLEIKMLIDVVQSSRFLTKKQADTIIGKLKLLCSKHERETLNHKVIIANRAKANNFHILYSMDKIHTAIETDKQIRFQYYGYNMYKQKEYHHFGNEYRVNPHALIYHQGVYLLLAVPAKDPRVRVYRVDRMENVEISRADRTQIEVMENIDVEKYAYGLFGVHDGVFYEVVLRCHKSAIDIVFDRFGFDTPIKKIDEDCFEITVSVALNADFYGWLVTLGGRVTIISPNRASRGFRITCSRVQHWMLNEYKAKRKKKFFYFVD